MSNRVMYDDKQLCSILDDLERRIPLKYRNLLITCYGNMREPVVELDGSNVVLEYRPDVSNSVVLVYALYAYAIAVALDDSQIMSLPLRKYHVDKALKNISEALGKSYAWLNTIDLHHCYRGEMVTSLVVGADAKISKPQWPVPQASVNYDAHMALRGAFGFDLIEGYGQVEEGKS